MESSAKQMARSKISPEDEDLINSMGSKTNLKRYLDNRLEMLDNVPDDLPEIVRFTVAVTVDASNRLEYFAKLLSHSKSGLANDILEEAIYDLEEALCGDLFADTEDAKKHRKALKIGEFAEEKKKEPLKSAWDKEEEND